MVQTATDRNVTTVLFQVQAMRRPSAIAAEKFSSVGRRGSPHTFSRYSVLLFRLVTTRKYSGVRATIQMSQSAVCLRTLPGEMARRRTDRRPGAGMDRSLIGHRAPTSHPELQDDEDRYPQQ